MPGRCQRKSLSIQHQGRVLNDTAKEKTAAVGIDMRIQAVSTDLSIWPRGSTPFVANGRKLPLSLYDRRRKRRKKVVETPLVIGNVHLGRIRRGERYKCLGRSLKNQLTDDWVEIVQIKEKLATVCRIDNQRRGRGIEGQQLKRQGTKNNHVV